MIFRDFVVRLPSEALEQIDLAIESLYPRLTDPQEFIEMAVEWALASLRQESK